ncbi:MAG: HAD hydrolase family protein [Candidatus Koribacter versatilis]|uniref:HAD hydrolase family protein n=1 Tax=Candidatus Korobacter versatilis TaxID=658062 RepID=A0A932A8N4_9BACT|nr:HAD hydrolase family protein [Candidatus Koribacter versatilis]
MSKAKAKKIKLILMDVDGVLTDGTIWLFPAPHGVAGNPKGGADAKLDAGGYAIAPGTMIEAKGFSAHDGTGVTLARMAGLKTGVITKRISETVALRARDLKLDYVHQGVADKAGALDAILKEAGLHADEVAFLGDDLVDLPIMRRCGLAMAVANAREEVKDEAQFITDHRGGDGAARDAIEFILRAQGKWDDVVKKYLGRSG